MNIQLTECFSGAMGFSLGFKEHFKIQEIEYSEVNKDCIALTRAAAPTARYIGRIESAVHRPSNHLRVCTAGFSCQDLSVASGGLGSGLSGERSGLFYPLIDFIRESEFDVVVLENVPGIVTSRGGEDFARVIKELSSLRSYSHWEWAVVDSGWFSAQGRKRWYCIGYHNRIESKVRGASVFPLTRPPVKGSKRLDRQAVVLPALTPFRYPKRQNGKRFRNEGEPAFTLTRTDRHGIAVFPVCGSEPYVREFTINELEALQGFPGDWTRWGAKESGEIFEIKGGEKDPDKPRRQMMGNAVNVPTVAAIAKQLRAILE